MKNILSDFKELDLADKIGMCISIIVVVVFALSLFGLINIKLR
jgi:hypothetical protein